MNGRYFTGEPIENRLDRLIDALNAGDAPDDVARDTELQDLAGALYAAESVREVQWPDSAFGRRMAARLSAELRHPRDLDEVRPDNRMLDLPLSPPTLNGRVPDTTGDRNTLELTAAGNQHRFRTFAQIAAAFAGFALLTYILVTVFSGASDNPLLGGAPEGAAGQIAYVSSESGNAEIYLIDADGSNKTNLTNNPASDTMPSWSPDGEQIAFVSDRDGRDAIYVLNADGTDVRQLYAPDHDDDVLLRNLSWSPDGASIALMRFDRGEVPGGSLSSVIVVATSSGDWRMVEFVGEYPSPAFGGLPAWSPDSKWLVFEAYGEESSRLLLADTSEPTSNPDLLQVVADTFGNSPTWSPTGELAIPTRGGVTIARLNETSLSLDEVQRIAFPGNGSIENAVWSPDGSHLAATLDGIWIANVDSHELTAVPESFSATHPLWSPDGSYLAYLRTGASGDAASYKLVVVNLDDLTTLATIDTRMTGRYLSAPVWRPTASAPDESKPAQPSATPTTENSRMALTPTPPSTTNASISVVPYELSCAGSAAVVGSGFVAGSTIDVFLGGDVPDRPDGSAVLSTTASDDGNFQFEDLVSVTDLIPNCEELAAVDGEELTFSAASVVEFDGEQHYAESAAHTPAFLIPTADSSSGATLMLEPAVGTCESAVTATGAGFEADTQVTIIVFLGQGDDAVALDQHSTVSDDGTFEADLNLHEATGCQSISEIPETGLQYVFWAQTCVASEVGHDCREPGATAVFTLVPDGESTSPEDSEQEMIDQATAAVREFLDEPEASFEVVEINQENRVVRISRQIDDAYDEFRYSTASGEIVSATIQSHSSTYVSTNPVDADRALEIAETVATRHHASFDLELHDTSDIGTIPGRDGQHQVFTATWQLKVNEVWVPTMLQIDVDMQTGRVIGYGFSQEPYDGPFEAQIAQEDAASTVEGAIATEPTLTGAAIGTVELATSYQSANGEWILVWRIYLDNAPESAPGPYIDVDAQTGDLLTDFGDPGGLG